MPSLHRPVLASRSLLAVVLPLAGMLSSGCYSANSDIPDTGVDADGLSNASGGSSTGPVTGERGILERDGFKLYWEQYDAWEQGSCMRMRLKNVGPEVAGWEMTVGFSDDITNWIDAGGAFMWLTEENQVEVEQEDFEDFEEWESTEMYFCAEPIVEIESFEVRYLDGDGRSGSTDGSTDDIPGFSGVMDYTDASGRSARLRYESWFTSELSCVDFDVENTGATGVLIEGFKVELSNDTKVVLHDGGALMEGPDDVLEYILDVDGPTEPGDSATARVCMEPLAQPTALLGMALRDPE